MFGREKETPLEQQLRNENAFLKEQLKRSQESEERLRQELIALADSKALDAVGRARLPQKPPAPTDATAFDRPDSIAASTPWEAALEQGGHFADEDRLHPRREA